MMTCITCFCMQNYIVLLVIERFWWRFPSCTWLLLLFVLGYLVKSYLWFFILYNLYMTCTKNIHNFSSYVFLMSMSRWENIETSTIKILKVKFLNYIIFHVTVYYLDFVNQTTSFKKFKSKHQFLKILYLSSLLNDFNEFTS